MTCIRLLPLGAKNDVHRSVQKLTFALVDVFACKLVCSHVSRGTGTEYVGPERGRGL